MEEKAHRENARGLGYMSMSSQKTIPFLAAHIDEKTCLYVYAPHFLVTM